MAGNVIVQVSPYPQVLRWEQRRCTGDCDAAPYVAMAFQGWQWCYYGIFAFFITKRSGFLILVYSNILGAVFGTYYTSAFWRHCQLVEARQNLQKYFSSIAALVALQACACLTLPVERALFITGLVASFCSFVGAISMLVSLPMVIRTKDSRSIPGPLAIANLGSSFVWCICGWMLADPLIAAPNVVAMATCLICLYLKARYPSDDTPPETLKKFADEDQDIVQKERKHSCKEIPSETTPLQAHNCPTSCDTGGTF
jgi:uncharacterized protein with PQ loop repeat